MSNSKIISDCRKLIIANAGPLDRFTGEARRAFRAYMNEEIEHDEVRGSRAWHVANTKTFKSGFSARLRWAGKLAMDAAQERYRVAQKEGDKVRDLVSIELSDLLESLPSKSFLPDSGDCG